MPSSPNKHRTFVEVNLTACLNNLRALQKIVNPARILAVVKSNAYGHGMIQVARILSREVNYFGVALADEALALRERGIGKPILLLGAFQVKDVIALVKAKIELPIYDRDSLTCLSRVSRKLKKIIKVHLKVETGMGRLGVGKSFVNDFIQLIRQEKYLRLVGIYSHFAGAEPKNSSKARIQLKVFQQILSNISPQEKGLLIHCSASAPALLLPRARFNMVRLGITLYGLEPFIGLTDILQKRKITPNLQPALTWKTHLVAIRRVPAGQTISYDYSFKAKKKMLIGILPIGYYDGYDRNLSNKAQVIIARKRCAVIGKVCMNATMVDLSNLSERPGVGEEVILFGRQGETEIGAQELANWAGTISYEIITRIASHVPRVYTSGEA